MWTLINLVTYLLTYLLPAWPADCGLANSAEFIMDPVGVSNQRRNECWQRVSANRCNACGQLHGDKCDSISILPNVVNRDMLVPRTELSLAGGVCTLQLQSSGTRFRHGCMRSTSISRGQFGDGLKTHFFLKAYTRSSEHSSFKSVFSYLLIYLLNNATQRRATVFREDFRQFSNSLIDCTISDGVCYGWAPSWLSLSACSPKLFAHVNVGQMRFTLIIFRVYFC